MGGCHDNLSCENDGYSPGNEPAKGLNWYFTWPLVVTLLRVYLIYKIYIQPHTAHLTNHVNSARSLRVLKSNTSQSIHE